MTKRYNIQTHPELARMSFPSRRLTYTRHAIERLSAKGANRLDTLTIQPGDVVEVEISYAQLSKIVVRQRQCNQWDRVMVLVPGHGAEWKVITCWLNHHTDNHKTLNRARISA
jgi:hypothetical protein